jgi:hypothetical protein
VALSVTAKKFNPEGRRSTNTDTHFVASKKVAIIFKISISLSIIESQGIDRTHLLKCHPNCCHRVMGATGSGKTPVDRWFGSDNNIPTRTPPVY